MDIIFKALLSLGAVFLIMYVLLIILRKYSNIGINSKNSKYGLKIENTIYVDNSTKIIDISNKLDNTRYIVAISKYNSLLIDKIKSNKE